MKKVDILISIMSAFCELHYDGFKIIWKVGLNFIPLYKLHSETNNIYNNKKKKQFYNRERKTKRPGRLKISATYFNMRCKKRLKTLSILKFHL